MKRILTLVAVVATMLYIAAPVPAQALSPTRYMKNTCSFQRVDPGIWTAHENLLTINCFARKYGVSVTTADAIARRESGLNRRAYNSSSCAEGLYQHICTYWPGRVRTFSKALKRWHVHDLRWTSPRAQAVVTMRYVVVVQNGNWCPAWC